MLDVASCYWQPNMSERQRLSIQWLISHFSFFISTQQFHDPNGTVVVVHEAASRRPLPHKLSKERWRQAPNSGLVSCGAPPGESRALLPHPLEDPSLSFCSWHLGWTCGWWVDLCARVRTRAGWFHPNQGCYGDWKGNFHLSDYRGDLSAGLR
jgi:hypothetical protein